MVEGEPSNCYGDGEPRPVQGLYRPIRLATILGNLPVARRFQVKIGLQE